MCLRGSTVGTHCPLTQQYAVPSLPIIHTLLFGVLHVKVQVHLAPPKLECEKIHRGKGMHGSTEARRSAMHVAAEGWACVLKLSLHSSYNPP